MAAKGDKELLRRPLYVFDLPPEVINESLSFKHDLDTDEQVDTKDEDAATVAAAAATTTNDNPDILTITGRKSPNVPPGDSAVGAQACSLCGLSFATVEDQRSHLKSDLHNYNLKQKLGGREPVSEADFEKLVQDLDESLSGSDSGDTEDDQEGQDSTLAALLKKQARIASKQSKAERGDTSDEDEEMGGRPGKGKPPMVWFSSTLLPKRTYFGVYKAVLPGIEELQEQQIKERGELEQELNQAKAKKEEEEDRRWRMNTQHQRALMEFLQERQLEPLTNSQLKPAKDGSLPAGAYKAPHYFLCMMGGGHFAAMIVSLAPRANRSSTTMDREAIVLAHRTFHRYTTRRKQGGSQSANDNAKGKANSAGAALRRYNEQALVDDIRGVLQEWKSLIESSELLFVRATGTSNRKTLFGEHDGQVLRQNDSRIRGFPFSTRRATQDELMRAFIELTRLKVQEFKPAPQAGPRKEKAKRPTTPTTSSPKPARAKPTEEEETAALHTSQIQALCRRSKLPALLSYLSTNELTADFEFYPADQNRHAPRPLHLAASQSSAPLVSGLLTKGRADPTITNADGKTAFELAGERAVRDAFRVARWQLGEGAWDWEAARVPSAVTKEEVERREKQEKAEAERKEAERRKAEEARLAVEGPVVDDKKKNVKQAILGGAYLGTPQQRREEENRGLTPEMKMRLERERRARAAEERIRKMQAGR